MLCCPEAHYSLVASLPGPRRPPSSDSHPDWEFAWDGHTLPTGKAGGSGPQASIEQIRD